MAWVIYLGMQDLHPGSESWLADWGRVLSLPSAMSAIEEGETGNLVTLLPQGGAEVVESLNLWLQQRPAIRCAVVYPQACSAIGQQLQQGAELKGACRQWHQQAHALLSLFRQHRRQLTVLTWPAAANTPKDEVDDPVPLPNRSACHEIEPVYSLLAQQALSQDAELAEAVRYLSASTHNAAQSLSPSPGLGSILERYRQEQQQQRQDLQTRAEALQVVREEREQARRYSGELKQSLHALEQQTQEQRERQVALQANHEQVQVSQQELEEENALLLEQLHSVQEKLEQAFFDRQGLEQQLLKAKSAQEELKQKFAQTQDQLKAEEGKSASLEQERNKLYSERDSLSAQQKSSEEENTLLLEQLHYVQEELERQILDRRHQGKQLSELQQAHQQQELLLHWLRAFGARANCAFYKKRPFLLKKHKALLASGPSFDADWYARNYPDVAESGIEPAVHYLKFGMLEGRNPSAAFDTTHYITSHPDIADAGENPLLHYIRWGHGEQRQTTPQHFAKEKEVW